MKRFLVTASIAALLAVACTLLAVPAAHADWEKSDVDWVDAPNDPIPTEGDGWYTNTYNLGMGATSQGSYPTKLTDKDKVHKFGIQYYAWSGTGPATQGRHSVQYDKSVWGSVAGSGYSATGSAESYVEPNAYGSAMRGGHYPQANATPPATTYAYMDIDVPSDDTHTGFPIEMFAISHVTIAYYAPYPTASVTSTCSADATLTNPVYDPLP